MTWKLTAIVSGAQTGADRGGLQAAIDLDLGWGGWAPAGWRAEDGEIPLVYRERMKCTSSSDYGMRTRLNVQDSDGTLIISFAEKLTGGSEFTQKTCERTDKSHLHLVLPDRGRAKIPEEVRAAVLEWIDKAKISVLNVAGPRESKELGLQEAVRDALVWIFEDETANDLVEVLEFVQIGADGKPDESTRRVEILSGVTLSAGPPEDGDVVRSIEEQATRIAILGTQPDGYKANPETVAKHPDVFDLLEREADAANAYLDAKERAFDEHGYGGKDPVDPSKIVGLEDFVDPHEGRTPWPHPNEEAE